MIQLLAFWKYMYVKRVGIVAITLLGLGILPIGSNRSSFSAVITPSSTQASSINYQPVSSACLSRKSH